MRVTFAGVAALCLTACSSRPAQSPPHGQGEVEAAPAVVQRSDALERSKPEAAEAAKPLAGTRLMVLGVAQDGGLPHAGCDCVRCTAARKEPARASGVASLGIVDPNNDKVFMIDATPDFDQQLALLREFRSLPDEGADRTPVDGIFLTHAHIGHYLGLAFLGFEALSTENVPVWGTPEMVDFLKGNAPWDQLIAQSNIETKPTEPGEKVEITDTIGVTAFLVPHRDEYANTVGYRIEGPRRTAVYIPDTSPWDAWETPMEDALAGVDLALLDATFYSGDELPGRDLTKIGHPLVVDTMDRLQARVDEGSLEVVFVHLNHSNPALDPAAPEHKQILDRGFRIGTAGEQIEI